MARQARFVLTKQDAWYHLISRVTGARKWYPFQDREVAEVFFRILFHYLSVYYCDLADYVLMGNHYHLVARFRRYRKLSLRELKRRADRLWRREEEKPKSKAQWRHLNARLFSLAHFMQDINREMAQWFNARYDRRGALFAGRYQSVLLDGLEAVMDCMIYVDLNPIRAGLVRDPEQWIWGGYSERHNGLGKWLLPWSELLPGHKYAFEEYRCRLYWRAGMGSRSKPGAIPDWLVESERARGFKGGEYAHRQSCFSRGVGLGRFQQIAQWLGQMLERGFYQRRRYPIEQLGGALFTLREQRGDYRPQSSPG